MLNQTELLLDAILDFDPTRTSCGLDDACLRVTARQFSQPTAWLSL
jgi:hypothetical protein